MIPVTAVAAILGAAPNPACPKCQCKRTGNKGKRRNRLPTLEIYECSECLHHFTTGAAGKNKSYPLKTILEAVSMFNLAGYVHILDYKPEARKEKHAHVQLTIYALALARSTGLKLKDFKCAWFDEKDYFEFFPLTAVYWPYAADGLDECRKKDVFHR